MRNVFKARIAPIMGIIALVAVMGCFLISCGEDPVDIPPLKGSVSIHDEWGPFTGQKLEAKYKAGDNDDLGEALYYWYSGSDPKIGEQADKSKGDTPLTTSAGVSGDDQEFFTPTSPGPYTVIAVDKAAINKYLTDGGTMDAIKSIGIIKSSPITVTVADAQDPPAFYGEWGCTAFTSDDFPSGTTATETIAITYRNFRLDSSWQGRTGVGNDKYTQGTHDYAAPNEYIEFEINNNGWSKLASVPSGYVFGYKLSVKTLGTKGYSAYSSFNIYQKTDGSTVIMRRTNNNGVTEIPRDYRK